MLAELALRDARHLTTVRDQLAVAREALRAAVVASHQVLGQEPDGRRPLSRDLQELLHTVTDLTAALDAHRTVTVLVKSCGHERDVTDDPEEKRPAVGESVSCWSACDRATTRNPVDVRVARFDVRVAP